MLVDVMLPKSIKRHDTAHPPPGNHFTNVAKSSLTRICTLRSLVFNSDLEHLETVNTMTRQWTVSLVGHENGVLCNTATGICVSETHLN